MGSERPVIEIDNLSFSYGELEVIKGISFAVERGEMLGFLGPNGAGKTTTAKLITGQLIATSGSIRVFDVDMKKTTARLLAGLAYPLNRRTSTRNSPDSKIWSSLPASMGLAQRISPNY